MERVWSACYRLLCNAHAGMYPITLETIIYLKYNQDWWGMAEVHKATEMDIGDLNEDMQDIINNDDNSDEEAW